jgi:hypothetical protein
MAKFFDKSLESIKSDILATHDQGNGVAKVCSFSSVCSQVMTTRDSSELCLSEDYPALHTCIRAWLIGVNKTACLLAVQMDPCAFTL